MKKLLLMIALSLPTLLFSQSKWNADIGGGTLIIKKDVGASAHFGIGYQASKHVMVNLNTVFSKPKSNDFDIKYDYNQVSLGVEYNFIPESNLGISSVMGFSYVHFGDNIPLKHNDGIGIDLGVRLAYELSEHFNFGFKMVNTYTSISPGGILLTDIFLRYNF